MYNKQRESNTRQSKAKCSCGGISKLGSKTNYPFGQNSKPLKSIFYKCSECGKVSFLKQEKKRKRY